MRQNIKALFLDWDHTVWDFEANSAITLHKLYDKYELGRLGAFSPQDFIKAHSEINKEVWALANAGKISREATRYRKFEKTLLRLGVPEHLTPVNLHDDYIHLCPRQGVLMPGVASLLPRLAGKYKIYILTNGFPSIQSVKLTFSGIENYFEALITEAQSGYMKPAKGMFDYAAHIADALPGECLMVGDDYLADVMGAINAGWNAVWLSGESSTTGPAPVGSQFKCIAGFDELKFLL